MSERWTDKDVERLVKEVSGAIDWLDSDDCARMNRYTGWTHCIKEALAPFRPDPEEELRSRVDQLRLIGTNVGGSFQQAINDIIAAVREHDAKYKDR